MKLCVEKRVTSFEIYMNLGGPVRHVYTDMPSDSSQLAAANVDVTKKLAEKIVDCSTTWLSCLCSCWTLNHAVAE